MLASFCDVIVRSANCLCPTVLHHHTGHALEEKVVPRCFPRHLYRGRYAGFYDEPLSQKND